MLLPLHFVMDVMRQADLSFMALTALVCTEYSRVMAPGIEGKIFKAGGTGSRNRWFYVFG